MRIRRQGMGDRGGRARLAADAAGARAVVERLLARARQISAAPYSGRRVPEYDHAEIREVLERPYRLIYRVKGDRVDILSVMHYRQLLPSDLRDL